MSGRASSPSAGSNEGASRPRRAAAHIGGFLLAYLLGIALAVALTPAELVLAGRSLWSSDIALAIPGQFAFYLYLPGSRAINLDVGYWLLFGIGLLPLLIGVASRFPAARRLLPWQPLWVGFPVGFVGTVGVYYTAAASI